ncbi:MAG: DUF928 domain-containing protein [Phormidesmis sp.]
MLLSIGSVLCITAPTAEALPSAAFPSTEIASQESLNDSTRQGLPGRRIGGGTRRNGIFLNENDALAALTAPEALTITTAAYPEMLFYVPEMKADHNAEFVMLNADGDVVYEQTLVANRRAGLINIDADGVAPLSLNENYEWYFSIIPNPEDRANDVVVHGSIRRVDADEWLAQQQVDVGLSARMAMAEPLVQAQLLYQEANLWHDAALVLNELRQENPENELIAFEWHQLLDVAELSDLVESAVNVNSH